MKTIPEEIRILAAKLQQEAERIRKEFERRDMDTEDWEAADGAISICYGYEKALLTVADALDNIEIMIQNTPTIDGSD